MCLAHKIRKVKKNSENGFVLIAALMGIIILLAVGFLALTITTGDMKIASRLVGERKAFSAAEAGIHELCRNFNSMAPAAASNVYFDAANDPTVKYSYALPAINGNMPSIPSPGYMLSSGYKSSVFDTIVTGEDTAYGSKTDIAVGTETDPRPADTQQGTN